MLSHTILVHAVEALVAATMLQALFFAFATAFYGTRASARGFAFLATFLFIIALTKADQLASMHGAVSNPIAFVLVLAPLQMLITPLLFFYLRGLALAHRTLRFVDMLHLLPGITVLVFLMLGLKINESETYLVLESKAHQQVIPLIGDALQLGYICAVFVLLRRHGIALRDWYAELKGRSLHAFGYLMFGWTMIVALHMIYVAGVFEARGAVFVSLNLLHWLFVNLVALFFFSHSDNPELPQESERYLASHQSEEERDALFAKARALLIDKKLYEDTELSLAKLADQVAATPRELSEAINGSGKQSFHEFVNRHRVERAKECLLDRPDDRVIDIAIECGFGSKSSFNTAFRKFSGVSPSSYRHRRRAN